MIRVMSPILAAVVASAWTNSRDATSTGWMLTSGFEHGDAGTEVVLVAVDEQDVASGAFAAADGLADASGADDDDDFLAHDRYSWLRGRAGRTRPRLARGGLRRGAGHFDLESVPESSGLRPGRCIA